MCTVAQQVERNPPMVRVAGSSPASTLHLGIFVVCCDEIERLVKTAIYHLDHETVKAEYVSGENRGPKG